MFGLNQKLVDALNAAKPTDLATLATDIRDELRLLRVAVELLTAVYVKDTGVLNAEDDPPPLPGTPEADARAREARESAARLLGQTDADFKLFELQDAHQARTGQPMDATTEEEIRERLSAKHGIPFAQ